uniref:SH2 domain-containing protein n=1 Tax=Mola mola TaxID=94237 RepID=A0A3Q3XA63_MOLML
MAQHEEPLYDFPEPTQPSARKFLGHHRSRGSLRSISVLDRLLLTVPVWFQLSINPATALHILQREPPGTFLVRKSRTSQRNVLCVRLTDDSVPSFVQQFGIREEHSKTCCPSLWSSPRPLRRHHRTKNWSQSHIWE